MQPEPKKHVSHAIAWSLIALLAGSLAFGIWAYFNQISDIYDNSLTISISHKKTTSTKPTTTTATATTDATADWKTYTNDNYGFSFKYPEDWTKNEVNTKQDSVKIATFTSPETAQEIVNKTPFVQEDITINYALAATKSITNGSGTIGLWLKDKFTNTVTVKDVTKETINGIVFNEAQIQADPSYLGIIAANSNGDVFSIDFSNVQNKSDLTSIEKTILSTFTFTK